MNILYLLTFLAPFVIFYWALSWEINHYRHHARQIRYRSPQDPLRVSLYIRMGLVAVGSVLMAIPFILMTILRPL